MTNLGKRSSCWTRCRRQRTVLSNEGRSYRIRLPKQIRWIRCS